MEKQQWFRLTLAGVLLLLLPQHGIGADVGEEPSSPAAASPLTPEEAARKARAERLRAKIRAVEQRRSGFRLGGRPGAKKLEMTTVRGSDRIREKIKAVEEDRSDSRKWLQKWFTKIRKNIEEGNKNRRERFKRALERERAARKHGGRE
jgi:Uncharacterized protein conserved in bacteria